MKNLLNSLLLCVLLWTFPSIGANATDYYFSSSSGSDANSGTESSPWQTLNKLNTLSLQPGDHVFFKKGDVFYGSINLTKSGSSGSPIVFDAYGSGSKPILTGLSDATGWTSIGANLWESSIFTNGQSSAMIVTINGVSVPMGKWPNGTGNSGWRKYSSSSGNSSVTDASSLPGSPNWTGATIVIRKNQYTIQKGTVNSQSGNTLSYTTVSGQTVNPTNGYGYFIQNHIGTLDAQNEWYYNSSTKKLDFYSTTTPSNVKIATVTSVVDLTNRSYISFSNIVFQGSNYDLITANGASNITFSACDLQFAGNTAFWASTINNLNFQNCTVTDNNNVGIFIGNVNSSGNVISNNTITNTGVYAGMSTQDSHTVVESCDGVLAFGGLTFKNNIIKNSGYSAIQFKGSNVLIQNNFIDSTCITKDEGASIYSYVGASDNANYTNQKIDGNIVLNAVGALAGKSSTTGDAKGIYMDINVRNVNITNNSVANCATYGILLQDNQNDLVRGNTVYNCGSAAMAMWSDNSGVVQLNSVTIRQNTFVMKTPNSSFGTIYYQTVGSSLTGFGSSDSNVIAAPLNDVNAWFTNSAQSTFNHFTLPQWQTTTSHDMNSKKSSKAISDVSYLRFEYNASGSSKTINLGATYVDVKGTNYTGSITLAPYTSAVLIYVSGTVANQLPVANAGPDQNFSLPTNSTTLTGSGTDSDGTIASYQWTKISGPSQYSIASSASAKTNVTNLTQGIYQFQLTVTDNAGGVDKDTVQITVNAATNQLPIAQAGTSQTIVLPTNSVVLDGSNSTDSDGSIVTYSWTKISGPSSVIISTPDLAITNVTTLTQGTYQFELKVTDDKGAIGKDTVQITVSPAANQLPVANAGPDINITLPTNSATLSGSGNDPDGTVASSQWTKISGPSQYSITSPAQTQTSVNNLTQGIYKFELKITDNSGAIDRDTTQVTVNAATANQPPTVNAGLDINLTLPTNSVTLSGIANDPDGAIVSYQWTKISGPAQYTIVSSTQAETVVNNLTQGIYKFELVVTDNEGAIDRDTIQVTVNSTINQSPIANAGSDIIITLPTNSVILSGSGDDPDGTIASYQWTKISGPAQYSIASPSSAKTSVTNLTQGVYQFQLTITDNSGAIATDIIQITVNAASLINQAPTANAGLDINLTLPTNSVTLSGIASDPDGSITSYKWTKISGPAQYTIVSSTQAETVINNLTQGIYKFELAVTDNSGAISRDTLQVTVNPAINQSPVANAGSDIIITLPTNSVTLSGTGTDPDGSIASYKWTKISGPSQYKISSSTSAKTSVTNLIQGVYQFQLTVTDNAGATATDIIEITVNATVNQLPSANAGADITITLPTNSVTLSGSGNDIDGTIASYKWTKISGPSQYKISSSASAKTSVNNLVEGVYQFELRVTDNQGAVGRDTIDVIVNALQNQAPKANAGPDVNVTLPTNSARLIGSGTDPDGSITSYRWASISGPKQFTINSPTRALTTISNLVQGVYNFQLTVTDNSGATAKDTVQVTVNAAAPVNQAPIANAGADINITLPNNSVTLSGSGYDADGSITSYQWKKVLGPSKYTIVSPTQAQTSLNNLVEGTYQFQLTVTDNAGASATDMIQIIVNAAPPANQAPTANAGTDMNITLPANSVTLSGNGTDPDGSITSYQWQKISGPSQYTIASPTQAQTSLTDLVEGVYQFELTVTDNSGATATDIIQITVNAASLINQAPTANAGTDIDITLPANSVTLSGNGTDPDGSIASYQWQKISGPSQYTITSPTQSQTSLTDLVEGVYQFELTVTDNAGATASDIIEITVNAAPASAAAANKAPKANAGSDKNVTLPTNSVMLSGNGSDTDGTISSYRWKKVSGPASNNIASSTKAQTTVSNLTQGVYQFELTVTDNAGATDKDTIRVTVYAAAAPSPNQPPTADAGLDINLTLPVNSINLTGVGTDADGTIASYKWTKISGPVSYTIVSPTKAETAVNDLTEGIYKFELTVMDNSGAIDKDTLQVTVNAAPINQLPASNAGEDLQITLPTDSIMLSGKGVDADGTITSYQWEKISGPTQYSIASPNNSQTMVKDLEKGVYQFELTVADNAGATAKDTIKVTVNEAPLLNQLPSANAGADIQIMLPTDSSTLSGKGTDPDGRIVSYLWAKISGPSQYIIATPKKAQTSISNLIPGVYQFELTVTDNKGAIAKDTVAVTVSEDIKSSTAKVYPNPATDVINIQISAATNTSNTSIRIYNNQGNLVYHEDFVRPQQRMVKQIDISKLQRGIYFAELQTDTDKIINLRFIKM